MPPSKSPGHWPRGNRYSWKSVFATSCPGDSDELPGDKPPHCTIPEVPSDFMFYVNEYEETFLKAERFIPFGYQRLEQKWEKEKQPT